MQPALTTRAPSSAPSHPGAVRQRHSVDVERHQLRRRPELHLHPVRHPLLQNHKVLHGEAGVSGHACCGAGSDHIPTAALQATSALLPRRGLDTSLSIEDCLQPAQVDSPAPPPPPPTHPHPHPPPPPTHPPTPTTHPTHPPTPTHPHTPPHTHRLSPPLQCNNPNCKTFRPRPANSTDTSLDCECLECNLPFVLTTAAPAPLLAKSRCQVRGAGLATAGNRAATAQRRRLRGCGGCRQRDLTAAMGPRPRGHLSGRPPPCALQCPPLCALQSPPLAHSRAHAHSRRQQCGRLLSKRAHPTTCPCCAAIPCCAAVPSPGQLPRVRRKLPVQEVRRLRIGTGKHRRVVGQRRLVAFWRPE